MEHEDLFELEISRPQVLTGISWMYKELSLVQTYGSSSKPLSHESSRDESNSILWLLTLFIGNRWGVGPKFFSTTNVEKIEPYI